jgi:hypothetical protein
MNKVRLVTMNKIANKVGHYVKSPWQVWFRGRACGICPVATVTKMMSRMVPSDMAFSR